MRLLRRHGLSARMLDRPNPDPIVRYAAKGTYRVRIAVPTEQADRAASILAERDARSTSTVADTSRLFLRQVLLAIAIASAVTCILISWISWVLALSVFCLTSVIALIGIGHWTEARRRRQADRCTKCRYCLLGLNEPRCPECGTPFDPAILERLTAGAQRVAATDGSDGRARGMARRLWVALLSFLVFDWSFEPPWRPAIEERRDVPPKDARDA